MQIDAAVLSPFVLDASVCKIVPFLGTSSDSRFEVGQELLRLCLRTAPFDIVDMGADEQ